MPTPTRRTPGADKEEYIPSMADYQRAINQSIHWPHYDQDGVLQPYPISEMPPARAINALHKVDRWRRSLFDEATEAIYDQAAATLHASPLVGALIEQALGPFYTGTYLQTTTAVPHLEEIVAGADEVSARREARETNELGQARMKDALMVISIDVLSTEVGERLSFGQRAVLLRDRLFDYLTDRKD
jgi:hypothetical protein